MADPRCSRRDLLQGLGAIATGALSSATVAQPVQAPAPRPARVTAELIHGARKEGKVSFYTALDIWLAEKLANAFEAKYPGIAVRVERGGSERLFQRIGQEHTSRIFAVDVVNSGDAAHYLTWKRDGWLAPYVPEEVAEHYPAEHKDADGMFATMRAGLIVMGYNTDLVKRDEAPKGFIDLLDPKWTGKIVKSHPGYSGTALSATYQMVREMGWDYFAKLSRQKVMQVQSANDAPKKLSLGERAIMADGNEYTLLTLKEAGQPVEVIYPVEGTPFITTPSAIFKTAPNPDAARLLQSYLFSGEAQQLLVDIGAVRSVHMRVKDKANRTPLTAIKLLKDDPAGLDAEAERIKKRYAEYFRV
jgi:iron(III) transport system substrate-binding protein